MKETTRARITTLAAVVACAALLATLAITTQQVIGAGAGAGSGERRAAPPPGHPFVGQNVLVRTTGGREYRGKFSELAYSGQADRVWVQHALLVSGEGKLIMIPLQNIEVVQPE